MSYWAVGKKTDGRYRIRRIVAGRFGARQECKDGETVRALWVRLVPEFKPRRGRCRNTATKKNETP